ncbi:MAG: fibronectin type III domain-containing protein [Burkholderiales bacterium]|nr:fibronectin type III domain-containing protein [Burkholderiales bacterium]
MASLDTQVPLGAVTGPIVLLLNDGQRLQSPVSFAVGGTGSDLAAPANLMGVAVSGSQINLTREDNSQNEDGFRIERQIGGGAWSRIAELPANTRAYTDSPLSPNNVYAHRVSAFNLAGVSNPSNTASARPTRIFIG